MTWGVSGTRGQWATPAAAESTRLMTERLDTNTACVAFCGWWGNASGTEVTFLEAPTVTDDAVVWANREATSLGQQVILKPILSVTDGTWRTHITFWDVDVAWEPKWSEWFVS